MAAIVAVLVVLLAYGPSLQSPFFPVDDPRYVVDNAVLQEVPLGQWWRFFTTRTNPVEYLPLRDLSYRVDLALFGLRPAGFRAHNLALYALTCGAVWWFVLSLLGLLRGRAQSEDRWIAAVTVALFAAHPAHVESVAWISGRKDVLSGVFAAFSLVAFTRAWASPRPSRSRLLGCYLLFACAILSKSTVVTVPVVAWLIGFAAQEWRDRPWPAVRRATAWTAPLFLLSAVSVFLQVWVSTTFGEASADAVGSRTFADRVLLAVRILGSLAHIGLFPVRLRLIYDVEAPGPALTVASILGLSSAVLTLAGVWACVRHRSAAGLGIAMAGILLVPFLQLIPFYTWSYASERFLFLPVIGLGLAAAVGLSRLPGRWGSAAAAALVLLGAAGTGLRATQWRDERALFADTLRFAPNHQSAAWLGIRMLLLPEGRFAEAAAIAKRVRVPGHRHYLQVYVAAREALHQGDLERLRPLVPSLLDATATAGYSARLEVSNMALEAGLLADAERAYRSILTDFPGALVVRYNLGLLLARQRRYGEAAAAMQSAVDAGYVTARVLNNLGLARRDAGQTEMAVEAFRRALATDSKHWYAAYNLARLLWARGDREGARQSLREARRRAVAAGSSTRELDEVESTMGAAGDTR